MIIKFIKKRFKNIKDFFKSPIGKVSMLFILFGLVAIPVVAMAAGLDKIFIDSSLEGYVQTLGNTPVEGAQIKLQGKSTRTNKEGYFKIEGIDYGRWDLEINANGFNKYTESISLKRFSNTKDFEIIPLDFGVIRGKLADNNFIIDQAELKFNEVLVKISEDGSFETEKLIVGQYTLDFKSPNYKDFSLQIDVKSGVQLLDPITLTPSGDIVGNLVDFISASPIRDASIKSGNYTPELPSEGGLKIRDIKLGEQINIEITKNSYITKKISVVVKQGENSLNTIELVENTDVVYSRSGNIYVSKPDGSEQKIISDGLADCKFLMEISGSIFFECLDSIYKYILSSNSQEFFASKNNSLDTLIDNGNVVHVSEEDGKTMAKINDSILFETSEKIISILPKVVDNVVIISTDSAVYKVTFERQTSEITKGIFYLQDVNGSRIIALNKANNEGTSFNLWSINLNGERQRITVFPEGYSQVSFINSEKLIYSLTSSNDSIVFRKFDGTTSKVNISGKVIINSPNRKYLTVSNGLSVYVLDKEGRNKKIF